MTNTSKPTHQNLPAISLGKPNVADDVLPALTECGLSLIPFLERHCHNDWGEVDDSTRQENVRAVLHGFRIRSLYQLHDGKLLVVRTNAGRSETTVDIEVDLADIWRNGPCIANT
jgi:hypothetical protein